jgi:hypothetical protein
MSSELYLPAIMARVLGIKYCSERFVVPRKNEEEYTSFSLKKTFTKLARFDQPLLISPV